MLFFYIFPLILDTSRFDLIYFITKIYTFLDNKEATGLTPADYIRKRRLTEIIKHMQQDVPISEIAFKYGFNSKKNFTRAFITEHHISPTEYKSALNSLKLYEAISFETPLKIIKSSIDRGIPAISWDIGVPEWGLITDYDDDIQMFYTLAINAEKTDPASSAYNIVKMPYETLGKREIPILSVLTITGSSGKTKEDILHDTIKLAVNHLNGGEWCDNAKGLDAYPALIRIFDDNPGIAASWNAECFLGTYGALKEYAYKYFEKVEKVGLAELYRAVFNAWMEAFKIKTNEDVASPEVRARIASLLKTAYKNEKEAVQVMESLIV